MTVAINALAAGNTMEITALVANCSNFSYTKAGNERTAHKYLLQDKTGGIEFVDWDRSSNLEMGKVYDFGIFVGEYNGKLQISKMVRAPRLREDLDPSHCCKVCTTPVEEMESELQNYVEMIRNPFIRLIADEMMGSDKARYLKSPAAKYVHGAYIHGLIEHVCNMAFMGMTAHSRYKRKFPNLSLDKIMFGCLLHDWGKMYEYDINNPSFPLTVKGHLVPHIVSGSCEASYWGRKIIDSAKEENRGSVTVMGHYLAEMGYIDSADNTDAVITYMETTLDELIHIMASHHGTKEWGSPVEPKTAEALIVHNLDMLDGRMMHAHMLMSNPPNNGSSCPEMTERSFTENVSYLRQEIVP